MNIKIKSSGVYCPFGNDYEKYYATLKKQLVAEDEQLFTERIPGYEYLQWELPGDGWKSLGIADPLLDREIRAEYIRRQQLICKKFGSNQEMALKLLSVPDDNYVYYKIDNSGKIQIKLTAWGYRYPERIDGGATTGESFQKQEKELVLIRIVYADKPMSNKAFTLNKILPRKTDVNGVYEIGELPIGYQFDINVDNEYRHITVTKGIGEICIDVTKYVMVEVQIYRDGVPYAGGQTTISYMEQQRRLTCDGNGITSARLPLSLDGEACIVAVEDKVQQRPLMEDVEKFIFQIISPSSETPIIGLDSTTDCSDSTTDSNEGSGSTTDSSGSTTNSSDGSGFITDSSGSTTDSNDGSDFTTDSEIDSSSTTDSNEGYDSKNGNFKWGCLLTSLLALLIGILLYFTFFICLGALF